MTVRLPSEDLWRPLLEVALAEDFAGGGDLTTEATVPEGTPARGALVAREAGVVAGLPVALEVFRMVDDAVRGAVDLDEGARFDPGARLAVVEGMAAPILGAERVALNLLGRMCGIATRTAAVVAAIAHTRCRVAATRKTTPGLRALEKYAVQVGGGLPHRFGLFDAVLIKDNHLIVAGGVTAAVVAARSRLGEGMPIEVEVSTLEGLEDAIAAGADSVLLDNMEPADVARAVEAAGGRVTLEASGGIGPGNAVEYAETGVDRISMGWLTHSVPSLDVALDFEIG